MKEQVKLQISLDKEVAQWIDDLNKKLGLRSRGWLINKLLSEVRGEEEENENLGKERL